MRRYTFRYSPEPSERGIVHRPVAYVHLQSRDNVWYLFVPYVDSGAGTSVFPKGDASLLKLNLYEGDYSPIMGIGRVKMLRIPQEVVEFCDLSEESSIVLGAPGEESILMFIPSNPRNLETNGILEKCDWKSQPQKPINYEGNLFIMVPKELLNRYNPENQKNWSS